MKSISWITLAATILFTILHQLYSPGWLLSLAITFGTTCYHFMIRLIIGSLIPNKFE